MRTGRIRSWKRRGAGLAATSLVLGAASSSATSAARRGSADPGQLGATCDEPGGSAGVCAPATGASTPAVV